MEENKYGYVYKTINDVNDVIYIGQSTRWDRMDDYLGSGDYLARAVENIGREHFKKDVLHVAESREELDYYEMLEIARARYNKNKLFNGNLGGPRGADELIKKIKQSFMVSVLTDVVGKDEVWFMILDGYKDKVISIIKEYYDGGEVSTEEFYRQFERELLQSQNLSRNCNRCGAVIGEICRTNTGNPSKNHAARNKK